MLVIRPCTDPDRPDMLAVINDAARRYSGAIPDDRWREPYMPADELDGEIAAGVRFSGAFDEGRLVGVMGFQPVRDVTLIRHAYVATDQQGRGVGGALLNALCADISGPILIGTWARADWAVRFYQRHGFALAAPDDIPILLRRYWTIPERQVATSVVLTRGL